MSARPYFSVVIAAYNAARWIVPTIRSALAQTYRDYEILVVGDGCSDATGEIVQSRFGASVQWMNLDRNHGGQSFPNNQGIRRARGTHIAYLGHDDVWSPRHLEALAGVFGATEADFAVSGAVYHGPPGSRYYQITGMFDDPRTAESQFFPPSSFGHKRTIVERIGPWREPGELRAPADCEFLLRAVAHRCTFASTQTITVHKFAAGHRYLSYRFASGLEQERMLERLDAPGGETGVLKEIESDIAAGADHPPIVYPDFERFKAGELFHANRRTKGVEKTQPTVVDRPRLLAVEPLPAGLDWYPLETDTRGRSFRWSGPNPNPLHLVNVRVDGSFLLRVHLLGFARRELAQALAIDVDGRRTGFARERADDGSFVLTLGPLAGPVEEGLVLGFHLPHCSLSRDPARRRVGLALSGVEVVPVP